MVKGVLLLDGGDLIPLIIKDQDGPGYCVKHKNVVPVINIDLSHSTKILCFLQVRIETLEEFSLITENEDLAIPLCKHNDTTI